MATYGEGGFSFRLEDVQPDASRSQEDSVRRLLERLARGVLRGGITKVVLEVSDE